MFGDYQTFTSVQEAIEYWTLRRDIANANLGNIESLGAGGPGNAAQAAAGEGG
jgi:hypothetical protein